MLNERFMVQGKRLDNGEMVQGYYCIVEHDEEPIAIIVPTAISAHYKRNIVCGDVPVDPATVEPVAVKLHKSDAGSSICPNCGRFIMQYEQSHGNIAIRYCKWCGQRLDWTQ